MDCWLSIKFIKFSLSKMEYGCMHGFVGECICKLHVEALLPDAAYKNTSYLQCMNYASIIK